MNGKVYRVCDGIVNSKFVIVAKYWKRVVYGEVKRDVGEILRDLAKQKKIEVVEGHLMPDHVHMCLKIHQNTVLFLPWVS